MNEYVDVIVTYNRKDLLNENIEALLGQTFEKHDILVIDNASTDGTEQMVKAIDDERIIYVNTGENLGGAGGFSFGIKTAIKKGYSYAWIMDDDSIPQPDALESLVNKADRIDSQFSFMASLVYWTDGKLFDMNLPGYICKTKFDAQYELIRDYKLLPINTCSFVGCFINLAVASTIGLPIAEFFIYGDDVEYTSRLKQKAPAYLDLDSNIVHKAPSNKGADIVYAGEDRIDRFFYQSRNGMYIARRDHKVLLRLRRIAGRILHVLQYSENNKSKRILVLVKGTIAGFFFNPEIEYPNKYLN